MTVNENYINDWKQKLDGTALPLLERYMSESDAHDIVIDFIVAIGKVRKLVKQKSPSKGLEMEMGRVAYATALDLMEELGW